LVLTVNRNVFIYKNIDDFLYEIRTTEYKDYRLVDCESVDNDTVISQDLPSLYKNVNYIFYNAQEIDKLKLISLINTSRSNNILAFGKIDKRSVAYKTLIKSFNVEHCTPIEKYVEKKSFINKTLKKYKLDINLLDFFIQILPENKVIIDSEIEKFYKSFRITKDIEKSKKSVCVYEGDTDVFEMMNSIFNKNLSKFYFYLNKVCLIITTPHLNALFRKKILYLLCLSKSNVSEARKYIATNDYIIKKDSYLSKKIGFVNLLKFYKYCEDQLDYYSSVPVSVKVLNIYKFFNNNILL
jgi:hypothetical protein